MAIIGVIFQFLFGWLLGKGEKALIQSQHDKVEREEGHKEGAGAAVQEMVKHEEQEAQANLETPTVDEMNSIFKERK